MFQEIPLRNFVSPYLGYVHPGGWQKPNITNRGRLLLQQHPNSFLIAALLWNRPQDIKLRIKAHRRRVAEHKCQFYMPLKESVDLMWKRVCAYLLASVEAGARLSMVATPEATSNQQDREKTAAASSRSRSQCRCRISSCSTWRCNVVGIDEQGSI